MFASPYLSYNPYEQYDPYDRYLSAQHQLAQQRALERQWAAQEQRARRAQYLPHEDFSDDGGYYGYTHNNARERAYAQRRLEAMRQEAMRQELVRQQDEQRRRVQAGEHHGSFHQHPHSAHPKPIPVKRRSVSPPAARAAPPSSSSPGGPARCPSPPTAETQPIPTKQYPSPSSEDRTEAATKIQTTYRIYRAVRTIADIERQFDALCEAFSWPETIDYKTPEGAVTVTVASHPSSTVSPVSPLPDTPKLAFTSTNYKLHAHMEALNRLLIKLDGIESWGDASVRKARRRVVGKVEAEASRVEAYWKQAWAAHVKSVETKKGRMDEIIIEDVDGSAVVEGGAESEKNMQSCREGDDGALRSAEDDLVIEEIGGVGVEGEVEEGLEPESQRTRGDGEESEEARQAGPEQGEGLRDADTIIVDEEMLMS